MLFSCYHDNNVGILDSNTLFKLISSPYWDCIKISDLQLTIITHINNTTDVRNLSPVINERVTDMLIQDLTNKIKNAKIQSKHK